MVNGNVRFGKDEMCSYTHKHNSAVHIMRIIILSFILSILVGCNNSDKIDSNLESILGNSSIRFEKEYSKDESLSLSGEGYSIQVLILSKETIDKFINFERKTEYPAIKNGFKTSTWEKTPINSNLINVQELVVNYFVKDNKQKTY